MAVNHNPHGLKPTDVAMLDADMANSSRIRIVELSPLHHIATVESDEQEGNTWAVMTLRLSPVQNLN